MDTSLLTIMFSCLSCCMFLHAVGGVLDVGGHSLATAMDRQLPSHPCLDQERSALLEFIHDGLSIYRWSDDVYHKTDSWNAGGDCCTSWNGVDCDRVTGHVIGLDLGGDDATYIYGSISGNNTLFQLFHLQKLNLSYNAMEGQIPSSIFHLSNLTSLDLSANNLRLHKPDLKDLVRNLTRLEHLHLSYVNMTGSILHDSLSNYTGLKSLRLSGCGLSGEFPSSAGIFHLSKLRVLHLSYNFDLRGHLPEFDGNDCLEELNLAYTSISGELPSSLGELSFLKVLDLGYTNISGELPSSINELFFLEVFHIRNCSFSGRLPSLGRLVNLTYLDLSGNDFRGETVSAWLGNLTQLVTLDLSRNQLTGHVLSSLSSLTKLESLWLYSNHFTGSIPSSLTNLTSLQKIDLSSNQFEGAIPNSFSNISKLLSLDLSSNNLNGTVELDMFHKLEDLSTLGLFQNNLSLLVNEGTSSFVRDKYTYLELSSCNLSKFPTFLLNQSKLGWLDLSQNNLHGTVPTWIWNHSLTIDYLNISHNFLTSIEDHPFMLPGRSLRKLDISFNLLQGSLPVPPLYTDIYLASSNGFSGSMSPLFCNLSDIRVLDISGNNISGTIPQCSDTFGKYMSILDLQNNKFCGTIPQSWSYGSSLRMISLSQNQLQGKVPRSLMNCTILEFIDFGDNRIVDTFPFWLGDLLELKVLMLQSNNFHGEIQKLEGDARFAGLRIIDLSFNSFSGKLPSMFFHHWEFMKSLDADKSMGYMKFILGYEWDSFYGFFDRSYDYTILYHRFFQSYEYTIKITNKGMERRYSKIPDIFRAIDFSHNQFEGEIPESIANLKGLHLLNLGHNNLTGTIPSWLGNLHQLESLDLSYNKLSGKIPRELSQLSFLAFFNVSYNNLSGIVPRGGQLNTFGHNSYEGNPGLLADPQREAPTPKAREDEDEDEQVFDGIEWMVILIGCASGLVVGAILGNELVVRKPKWFVRQFKRWL